jgi:putative transcriptional regulator
MPTKAFKTISDGLLDAIAFARGEKRRGRKRKVRLREVDVETLRMKLGLSQRDFAGVFGVSVGTVRNWEQGRRHPEGPARVLLNVIEKAPRTVLRAIWSGRAELEAP